MSDPNIELFDEGLYESDKDEDIVDWSPQVRLKYWCDNCRVEYDLYVNQTLECTEIGHKIYSLDEWKKKQYRNYKVVSFPKDAQEGEHIICCDGSLRKKVFSCAVIFRDNKLNFEETIRMVKVNQNMTSIQVEVEAISLAILRAVHVFRKLQNKKICYIYSDCQSAVKLYCGSQITDNNSINQIFTNRKKLIKKAGLEVQIKWIYRENNKIADRLAKKTTMGYYISKGSRPLNIISRTLYEEKILRINRIKLLRGESPMEEGTRHILNDLDEADLWV